MPRHLLRTCPVQSRDWVLIMSQKSTSLVNTVNDFDAVDENADLYSIMFSGGMEQHRYQYYGYITSLKRSEKRKHFLKCDENVVYSIYILYRSCDGYFHFRLEWPELRNYNDWWQNSDPTLDTTVNGFVGKFIPQYQNMKSN